MRRLHHRGWWREESWMLGTMWRKVSRDSFICHASISGAVLIVNCASSVCIRLNLSDEKSTVLISNGVHRFATGSVEQRLVFTVTAFPSTDFTSFRLYHPAPFAVWLVVRSPNPVSGDFPVVRETNQTSVRNNAIIYTVIQFIHIQGEQKEAHLREASL